MVNARQIVLGREAGPLRLGGGNDSRVSSLVVSRKISFQSSVLDLENYGGFYFLSLSARHWQAFQPSCCSHRVMAPPQHGRRKTKDQPLREVRAICYLSTVRKSDILFPSTHPVIFRMHKVNTLDSLRVTWPLAL